MNPDHYAIVFGLSDYPLLGTPPPANLNSPAADADVLVQWLTGPGGLPDTNIKLIRSGTFQPPPAPTRDQLEQAFRWLNDLAEKNSQAGRARSVGQRIYLYASGHGFSPGVSQACLLAGNATENDVTANVFPSAWLDWLQDANYFREFVLWMDCCMDRLMTQPSPPPLRPILSGGAPGPSFVAFGAPRPLKAVERAIAQDGGKFHGIFTWNLLEGLRGAAADERGFVTARSLSDWLRQSQLSWLDASERDSPDVAKEPYLSMLDDIVFARNVAKKRFDVTLMSSLVAAPSDAYLWSGHPPKRSDAFTLQPGGTTLPLTPGLYVAEVPAAGLRHGFAVTRSDTIALSDTAARPSANDAMFALNVDPGDPVATIRVVGHQFQPIDRQAGRLNATLPFGLYSIRLRTGRQVMDKVILLDAPWQQVAGAPASALPAMPLITSAAPLPATRTTNAPQQTAAREGTTRHDIKRGAGAELMVMCRSFGEGASGSLPWEGVSVLDSNGQILADLATAGTRSEAPDPVGVCSFELSPGAYVLRYPLGGGTHAAQSLILPPGGWRVEAYLLHSGGSSAGGHPRMSLFMHRTGAAWGSGEEVLLEKARVALADERLVLNDELSALLLLKFENPLAGIIGGYLLLIEHETGDKSNINLLNTVVGNLRQLVGDDHPDVEALSLACPDRGLRTRRSLSAPPLFERGWRLFVEASQLEPTLVPLTVWQQVHATIQAPPFLSWSTDATVQRDFRKAMNEVLRSESRGPAPAPALAAAAQAVREAAAAAATRAVQGVAAFMPFQAMVSAAPPAVTETAETLRRIATGAAAHVVEAAAPFEQAGTPSVLSVVRTSVLTLPPLARAALLAEFPES